MTHVKHGTLARAKENPGEAWDSKLIVYTKSNIQQYANLVEYFQYDCLNEFGKWMVESYVIKQKKFR